MKKPAVLNFYAKKTLMPQNPEKTLMPQNPASETNVLSFVKGRQSRSSLQT